MGIKRHGNFCPPAQFTLLFLPIMPKRATSQKYQPIDFKQFYQLAQRMQR